MLRPVQSQYYFAYERTDLSERAVFFLDHNWMGYLDTVGASVLDAIGVLEKYYADLALQCDIL